MSHDPLVINLLIFDMIPTTLNPINRIIVNIGFCLVSFGRTSVVDRWSDFGHFIELG